jgi:hypothetical protein
VVLDDEGHFCNSSGSHVFGLFEMEEIRDYWQDQTPFLSMVEDKEPYFSFKLS